MLMNPRLGQVVQIWYRASIAAERPHHGRLAKVVVPSKGRPRNHGVEIDGRLIVVPAGNLRDMLFTRHDGKQYRIIGDSREVLTEITPA